MYKSILLFYFFALGLAANLFAQQPVFTVSQLSLQESSVGSEVAVDIAVANFNSIVVTQFSINWDVEVLHFAGVNNLSALGLAAGEHFGTTPDDINAGKMRFAWYPNDVSNGVSLPDGTIIFSVKFTVVGNNGDYSAVEITNDPIVIEVADVDNVLQPIIQNGGIGIGNVATDNIYDQNITTLRNIPNPFTDFTQILFSLKSADNVKLGIYDSAGKLVYTKSEFCPKGDNAFMVNADWLPASGLYSYKIETSTALFTKKLILFK